MNKGMIILGALLLVGLGVAFEPWPSYINYQVIKINCMYNFANHMAGEIDGEFLDCDADVCPGEEIYGDMKDAGEPLEGDLMDGQRTGDYRAFQSDYVQIISLFNQMRVLWLQSGFMWALDGGDMGELMGAYMQDQRNLAYCFTGRDV